MKSLNLLYLIVCLALGSGFVSCTDENINSPAGEVPIDIVYADSMKITQFVSSIYSYLPSGWNRLGSTSMVACATDEAVHSVTNSEAQRWAEGSWDANTLHDDLFDECYAGIRRSFIFEELILPNIEDYVMKPGSQNQLMAQVHFVRAYLNFELLKRFGGYPLVKRYLSSEEDLAFPRNTYDECVDYIVELCDVAAKTLPFSYVNKLTDVNNQLGRATKGAAMALKARTLLYAASPLFNDPDKPENTLEHGKYDVAKWEAAAAAAAAVINLNDGNNESVYALYTAGTGYDAFFNALASNSEIIISRMELAGYALEKNNGLVSITGGSGGTCPTWDLVCDYEMIDGTPFDWNNPEHAANPFAGREPRFGKSILYNEATWRNNMIIETFEGGKDKVGINATRTSFYLRKFLSINASWNAPLANANHCFPLIRYAEVLLNYAEAMNAAYGPDVDPQNYGMTARGAIKLIRTRAGLTGNVDLLTTVPSGDQAKMTDAIRHERRIELVFEEHRHLDVRRWKIAETVFNKSVSGLKIGKNSDATYTYTPEIVENRVFDKAKMYLYPFPQTEIGRNPNLIQNTGW